MSKLARRSFLAVAAGSTVASSFARSLKVIGVQLYTVRDILPKDPAGVLHAIDEIGYREVEVVAASLDEIWPSLKRTNLKAVSMHLDTALFTRQHDKLPAALENAKQHGFQYVVCPYIAPQDRGGVEVIKKLGENLNQAGGICHRSGLRLCYHNHAFEWERVGGQRLLDVLMQTTDPKLVSLELDVMWAHVGGVNPVEVLRQYGKRIPLVHLKDVSAEVHTQYNERIPRSAFKEVGHGVIDFPAVLRAAAQAGVEHYFVEQDQTPGNPIDSLRQSYTYLQKADF